MQWKRLVHFVVLLAISSLLVACGGGHFGKTEADQKRPAPSNLSQFQGIFAFSATGTDSVGNYFVAGSFSANGKGDLVGVEDLNFASGVESSVDFSGTYRVEGGTVIASLSDSDGAPTLLTFAVPNNSSSVRISYAETGTGTLQAQSTKDFSNAGTFVFTLNGEGRGDISGSGKFTTSVGGAIVSGSESYQDGSFSEDTDELTGLLSPAFERGRGTAVIGGNIFSYYVISRSEIVLAGLENARLIYGTAIKQ